MKIISFILIFWISSCYSSGTFRSEWDSVSFSTNGHNVEAKFSDFDRDLLIFKVSFNPQIIDLQSCLTFEFVVDNKNQIDLSTLDLLSSSSVFINETKADTVTFERLVDINLSYKAGIEGESFENVIDFIVENNVLIVKHLIYTYPGKINGSLPIKEQVIDIKCFY